MSKNKAPRKKSTSTAVLSIGLALIVLLALGIMITVYFRSSRTLPAEDQTVLTESSRRTESPKMQSDENTRQNEPAEAGEQSASNDALPADGQDLPVETAEAAQPGTVNAEPEETPESPHELKTVVTAEELETLDLTDIQRLDLTGSTCYDEIEAFTAEHPELEVVYAVMLSGSGVDMAVAPDTKSLHISDASYLSSLIENAARLPELSSVSLDTDIAEPAEVDALRVAFPGCAVNYSMTLLGMQYPYDIEEIRLTGLDAEGLNNVLPELERFPNLRAVSIPEEENDISAEDALAAAQQCPLLVLDSAVELFGHLVSLNTERLEFENEYIGNEGVEELREMLPMFKNLQYLKLDSCDVDNETMEKLRDDYPDIKVVWRVFFGSYHCLTDTEMIWATGGTVNDSTSGVLKYCTDVKYMDLGHTLITQVDFLNYMPKLEVLIIAISWVENIEPIANCPNLEYLEMFSARVSDLSPIAQCTHVQHLNIGSQRNANNVAVGPTDISSLYDLPEIKRFYCTMSYVPESQQQEIISRHPDCEFEFRWVDPAEGYWRFIDGNPENNTIANRNERYALLCEQFGYDTYQQSGKTWSLYG